MKSFFTKNWFLFSLSILLIYRILIALSFKPELINGETNNIWSAINFVHGKSLYSNPEELPLEIFQYTPLSQFPVIFFAKVLPKNNPYYVYLIWVFGRFLQILYNLSVAFLISYTLKTCFDISKKYRQLFIILFLGGLTHASFSIRPDSLQMLLVVLVFTFFSIGYFRHNRYFLVLSALIVGVAVLAKQDGFLIMFPLTAFLLFKFEWKKMILFSLLSIGSIIFFISLFSLFFGEYFFISITKGISNQPLLSQVIVTFYKLINLYFIHFIFIVICFYLCFKNKWYLNDQIQFFLVIMICYFIFGVLTSSKIGSWVNYYSLFFLFSFIFTVKIINLHFDSKQSTTLYLQLLVSITVSLFVYRQTFHYLMPYLKYNENKKYYLEKYDEFQLIKNIINPKKSDNVLVMNYLQRNFFAVNTLMVNIEYYWISKFDYSKIKNQKIKNIKFIVKNKNEQPVVQSLCKFFKVDTNTYVQIFENKNLEILKLK